MVTFEFPELILNELECWYGTTMETGHSEKWHLQSFELCLKTSVGGKEKNRQIKKTKKKT